VANQKERTGLTAGALIPEKNGTATLFQVVEGAARRIWDWHIALLTAPITIHAGKTLVRVEGQVVSDLINA
jgi:hypothetical protein